MPIVASRTERAIVAAMGADAGAEASESSTERSISPSASPRRPSRAASTSSTSAGGRGGCSARRPRRRGRRALLSRARPARRAGRRPQSPPRARLGRGFFAGDVHEVARPAHRRRAPRRRGRRADRRARGLRARTIRPRTPTAGETARNASMFGPPGHAYVYRSYGMHWCLNLVCGPEGSASAVLVRALEPTRGLEAMRAASRARRRAAALLGPRPALSGTRRHAASYDGLALDRPPFELHAAQRTCRVVTGPRIGISKAVELPWRYGLAGSRFLSRPFPARRVRPPSFRATRRRRRAGSGRPRPAARAAESARMPRRARLARARASVRPTRSGTTPCSGRGSTSVTLS